MDYKALYTFEQRSNESQRIMKKYKNKYPVIVTIAKRSNIDIGKHKFLVSGDMKMSELQYVIRRRVRNLTDQEALWFYVNNTIPASTQIIANIFAEGKDKDGFLYMTLARENTFG